MTSFKKIVIVCALCLDASVFRLRASNEPTILRLEFSSGNISYIELSTKPVISFCPDSIIIRSSDFSTVVYNCSVIKKICFIYDINTAVKKIGNRSIHRFQFVDGENVNVSGINRSDVISIYSVDGKSFSADIEHNSDYAIIHLSGFPNGIYIIKVGLQSYKIYKK